MNTHNLSFLNTKKENQPNLSLVATMGFFPEGLQND